MSGNGVSIPGAPRDDAPGGLAIAGLPSNAVSFALERPEPAITPTDRLGFTAFLAIALHAAAILGIGFALPDEKPPLPTLEVTLAQFSSEQAPDEADFLAQANQIGSGTLDEVRELTTDRDAPMSDTRIADVAEPVPAQSPRAPQETPRLTREEAAADSQRNERAARERPETEFDAATVLAQARDVASLDARRSSEVQLDAKGRRVRRLTSVSARTAVEAAYLESWRAKIERIGNLNYPMEARRQGLEGDLRVIVEVDAAGRLLDVRILESSGSAVLDASALRIVRLAAPFLPFPAELRSETDVLHIIRTWQFRRRGFNSTG